MPDPRTEKPFYPNLEQYQNQVAVILPDGRHISYAELEEQVSQFSKQYLGGSGLVFLFAKNVLSALTAYLACLQSNRPVVLLDGSIVVGSNKEKSAEWYSHYRPTLTIEANEEGDLAQVTTHHGDKQNLHPELALLLPTSGTTGSPKFVRLSHRNLTANAAAISSYLAISPQDRAITNLPLFYTYGLSVINSHLHVGATLMLTNEPIVSRPFWQFFDQYQPTSMAGVPHTYEILERLRFLRKPLSHLHYMTQAGGKLAESKVRTFAQALGKKNIRFYVMYGQTEATARMSYLEPDEVLEAPASVGRAIPGGSFSLVNDNKQQITESKVTGSLIYRGDNVMMGYAKSIDDLDKGYQLNHLVTGDRAWFDEAGRYYLSGRSDRFIKIYGYRVDLDDLEKQLQIRLQNRLSSILNDEVQEQQAMSVVKALCAGREDELVVGVLVYDVIDEFVADRPDDRDGVEGLAGERYSNKQYADLLSAAKDTVLNILAIHHKALTCVLLNEMPLTASGKVSYARILEQADQ